MWLSLGQKQSRSPFLLSNFHFSDFKKENSALTNVHSCLLADNTVTVTGYDLFTFLDLAIITFNVDFYEGSNCFVLFSYIIKTKRFNQEKSQESHLS